MQYEDILYDVAEGVATITINRPQVMNAFRGQTCEELIHALQPRRLGQDDRRDRADRRRRQGVLHRRRSDGARRQVRRPRHHRAAGRGAAGADPRHAEARDRQGARAMRSAAATCWRRCATSRSRRSKAQFGQVGPKVGSVDPGFGTAYLARVVGEKKAREMWYLCRRYTRGRGARDGARQRGRAARPSSTPRSTRWCAEIMEKSPTAIAIAKRSFNADSENIRGIGGMGMQALSAVLRHRGIAGGRARVQREAQARLPQVCRRMIPKSVQRFPPVRTRSCANKDRTRN